MPDQCEGGESTQKWHGIPPRMYRVMYFQAECFSETKKTKFGCGDRAPVKAKGLRNDLSGADGKEEITEVLSLNRICNVNILR